jgi:hypothetical protein
MTDHTIPPRELVEQWASEKCYDERDWLYELHIANRAAQWGADQELEACCEWVSQWRCLVGGSRPEVGLRAARRPKPPSLKEEALGGLDQVAVRLTEAGVAVDLDTIRRALEALPDNTPQQS